MKQIGPPDASSPPAGGAADGDLRKALEALLFITDRPLSGKELCTLTQVKDQPRVEALVAEMRRELDERGSSLQIMEVAQGYQMATRAQFAPFVRRLFVDRMTMKFSAASLETLAIIAYKQPITRSEIEEIRGVEVIAALETLMEKGLAHVVGRKETVGRPLMYGTTPDFMRHFGLRNLEDLPPLEGFAPNPEGAVLAGIAPDAAVPGAEPRPADTLPEGREAPKAGFARDARPSASTAPRPADAPSSPGAATPEDPALEYPARDAQPGPAGEGP
ncbi:MAG: SMC-Scp complex subunit ScpB [Elusimicrobia bacterium]|nr:SMC-Scp complex subunit ScpB [Elusimicrobiota bacterium]